MSELVGAVHFNARVDGKDTPRQAREVGEKSGKEASEGYDRTWSKGFRSTLSESARESYDAWRKNGQKSGDIFGEEFSRRHKVFLKNAKADYLSFSLDDGFLDQYRQKFDSASEAAGSFQKELVQLQRENVLTQEQFAVAKDRVKEWVRVNEEAEVRTKSHRDSIAKLKDDLYTFRQALADVDKQTKVNIRGSRDLNLRMLDLGSSSRDASGGLDRAGGSMPKFSYNARQVVFWTTVVASAMEQMATLGSAIGPGLLAIGSGASALVAGVGVGAVAISGLLQEADKLPPSLKAASDSFKGLGDNLSNLRNTLTEAAFANSAATFDLIGASIDRIGQQLVPLAQTVGTLTDRFAAWLASTEGASLIGAWIEPMAKNFESLSTSAGLFAEALIRGMTRVQPLVDQMLNYIQRIGKQFNDFTKSDDFDTWVDNASRIFKSFGGLIDGVARTLNNLVTPESVNRTTAFLDNLTGSLPFLQTLFEILGELDIFGVIAEMLDSVGNALIPIMNLVRPMVELIGTSLVDGFKALGSVIDIVSVLLLPLRVAFELLQVPVMAFMEWMQKVSEPLEEFTAQASLASEELMQALEPAIDALGDAFIQMLPSPEEFTNFVKNEMIPAIGELRTWIAEEAVPAIQQFAKWFRDEAVPAMQGFWDFLYKYVFPVLATLGTNLDKASNDFEAFVNGIKTYVSWLVNPIKALTDLFNGLTGAASASKGATSANLGGGGGGRSAAFASGGTLYGPRRILAGEAGPEAIVPLQRSLSQVDPSVRWLSAIAQGKMPAMAGGGVVGGGKQVNFTEGAIVVQGYFDPRQAAIDVGNEVAERVAS